MENATEHTYVDKSYQEKIDAEHKELVQDPNTYIYGILSGDLSSHDRCIICSGTITGNIISKAAVFKEHQQIGNIQCRETVTVDEMSVITGDIYCDILICSGVIHGNVIARKAVLRSFAVLDGNLDADEVEVGENITFKGYLKIGVREKDTYYGEGTADQNDRTSTIGR